MRVDELLDGGLELRHTLVGAAAQLLVRQLGEPSLHETQPRPVRGCEMDVKPWTLGEPVPNERCFMRAVVVHDDVHVEVTRDFRLDQIEELAELDRAMTLMKLRDDLTGLRVERGEQRGRAVPIVVMCAALHLAGPHRQERLRAVQRLDLGFFVDAEYRRVLRRIQIQPHDVTHLFHEQRVGRQLERLAPMRLQAERTPDPIDGHATQVQRLGHVPGAPVRGPARRGFERSNNHLLDLVIGNRPRRTGPRFVVQAVESLSHEAPAPLPDRARTHVETPSHHLAVEAFAARQDDARTPRHVRRRPRSMGQRFESRLFLRCQDQRGFRASCSHARLLVEQYEQAAQFVSLSTGTGH